MGASPVEQEEKGAAPAPAKVELQQSREAAS